jgi:hypothetical protein
MNNRLVSLFDLDRLLAAGSNGPSRNREGESSKDHTKDHTKGHLQGRAKRRTKPASEGVVPKDGGVTVSQSFDTGAPIRCEHDVTGTRAVERIDVSGGERPMAQGLDDSYRVEAFEDEELAEEEPLSASSVEAENRDAMLEAMAYADEDAERAEEAVVERGGERRAEGAGASDEDARERPASFAAQMAAVEHDLNELAARAAVPPPEAPTPPSDEDGAAPARPMPATGVGHGVFDAMAQGMNYATEFRLPAVQLTQMFTALDRELDAERAGAPPPVPTGTADAPVPPPTAELISDLVALTPVDQRVAQPPQPPDATDRPAPAQQP